MKTESTVPMPTNLEIVPNAGRFEIYGEKGDGSPQQCIATFFEEEQAENFLRAVSCHEELVSAAKDFLEMMSPKNEESLRFAIAKAEGK